MKQNIITTLLLAFLCGCATNPTNGRREPREIHEKNKSESWSPDSFPLSPEWDVYRKNLPQLLGLLIVVYPSDEDTNRFVPKVLGTVITAEAKTNASEQTYDETRYSSKVDGNFAANLSFAIGRVAIKGTNLYDLTLKDSNGVLVIPDSSAIDQTKLQSVYSDIPQTFKAILFATAIKHSILASRDFYSFSGDADASYSIIKVDGKYYTSSENTQLNHMLILVGLDKSGTFGTYDPNTKLYTKKRDPMHVEWKSPGTKAFDSTRIKEIRRAISTLNKPVSFE